MGCNPHPRGWVWRGGGYRNRATCCLTSSLLISSLIFFTYGIFFIDYVVSQNCKQCAG